MISLSVESVATVKDEIGGLLQMHYDEVAMHKDRIKLDPDWGRYEAMEINRALAIFTARDHGKLVGYAVFVIAWHLHYKDTLLASNDVLFLHPDYRSTSSAGLRLIQYADQRLAGDYGVDKIVWHIKLAHDWRQILHRAGYVDEEVLVGRIT